MALTSLTVDIAEHHARIHATTAALWRPHSNNPIWKQQSFLLGRILHMGSKDPTKKRKRKERDPNGRVGKRKRLKEAEDASSVNPRPTKKAKKSTTKQTTRPSTTSIPGSNWQRLKVRSCALKRAERVVNEFANDRS